MVDFSCNVIPRPNNDAAQEVFHTRCKSTHALKISISCAVFQKWTHEVVVLSGRASDLTAWVEQ